MLYLIQEIVIDPTPCGRILRVVVNDFIVAKQLCDELKKKKPNNLYEPIGVSDVVDDVEEALEILFPLCPPPTIIKCPDDMPDEYFRKLGDW